MEPTLCNMTGIENMKTENSTASTMTHPTVRLKIKILRQQSQPEKPYWENFDYEGSNEITVASLLDFINFNDDIINDKGEKTTRINWECSCLQGMCGSCAMVINEKPALACETFLKDLKNPKNEITICPLKKFPVIKDLIVDRSSIYENLKKSNIFIGEYKKGKNENDDFRHQYDVSKCLKCALCLEVCPNYTSGNSFFGSLFANECYLVSSRNNEKLSEIKKIYKEHFEKSCSKSLACVDVCPMKIPTLASIAKMNKK